MWYNEKNDTYVPDFQIEIEEEQFNPLFVPWINQDRISQDISVQT